jgi:hypothetical protein
VIGDRMANGSKPNKSKTTRQTGGADRSSASAESLQLAVYPRFRPPYPMRARWNSLRYFRRRRVRLSTRCRLRPELRLRNRFAFAATRRR